MWLIVGLGNPGQKYLFTRHNIGFMVIDHFLTSAGGVPFKTEKKALTCRVRMDGEEILFAKPQTYMNLSGQPVSALMNYYKIEKDKLLVIHDDLDQAFGHLKFQQDRGGGGHNGIKSIHEQLGTQNYQRLKIGIDRPSNPAMDPADYVLQNFSNNELEFLPQILERACEGLESLIFKGFSATINEFNRKNWLDQEAND